MIYVYSADRLIVSSIGVYMRSLRNFQMLREWGPHVCERNVSYVERTWYMCGSWRNKINKQTFMVVEGKKFKNMVVTTNMDFQKYDFSIKKILIKKSRVLKNVLATFKWTIENTFGNKEQRKYKERIKK